ncbi:MAG: SRPBCC family protein [Ilumatobacteraceae bacterium]
MRVHSRRTIRAPDPALDDGHRRRGPFGIAVFPNMMLDITGTCIMSTTLHPRSAGHTTVVTECLFDADVVAAPGFDPSPVVDFNELVGQQDCDVCEMVQRGVRPPTSPTVSWPTRTR